jgi:hypothetical protein
MGANGHQPDRPGWDCRACGQPWPCSPARVQLGDAYGPDRAGLAIYMASLLDRAVVELPRPTPLELFERFVAWTR